MAQHETGGPQKKGCHQRVAKNIKVGKTKKLHAHIPHKKVWTTSLSHKTLWEIGKEKLGNPVEKKWIYSESLCELLGDHRKSMSC